MIEMKDFVAVYDNALDLDLCREMIKKFELFVNHQTRNGAGIREGLDHSGWTEMDITPLSDLELKQYFQNVVVDHFERYKRDIRLTLPISPLHKLSELRIKRYSANRNDQFQVHFDSIRELSNRYLVFLWYLNDIEEGGETEFPDLGLRIKAKMGRLLVFPPYWMFQHAGLPPSTGDKYIISTYALY